ncbi:hypothetical protein HDU86_007141 [Geranomyces michiganensis]|nr:hypothetical protein HDU86_007141 [Geranomyces michiganensis]
MVPNLHAELQHLIRVMKTDSQIDFENDFKLLTIFIGNNDACLGCLPVSAVTWLSPQAYELALRAILDRIRASIPRVVVNIMQGFNVSQVWDVTRRDGYCETLRNGGAVFECACAFLPGPAGAQTRAQMDSLIQAYNARIPLIAASYNTNKDNNANNNDMQQHDSFAVIVDPLLRDARIQRKHLSNADCFHPTKSVHRVLARGVWENLFRRAGEKRGVEDVERDGEEDGVWCPGEGDRIVI